MNPDLLKYQIFYLKNKDLGEFFELREGIRTTLKKKNSKLFKMFESFNNLLEHQNTKDHQLERENDNKQINAIISKTVKRFDGTTNQKENYSFKSRRQMIYRNKNYWFRSDLSILITHCVHGTYHKQNNVAKTWSKRKLIEQTYFSIKIYVDKNIPKNSKAKIRSRYSKSVLTGFIVSEFLNRNSKYSAEFKIDTTGSAQKIYNQVYYRLK